MAREGRERTRRTEREREWVEDEGRRSESHMHAKLPSELVGITAHTKAADIFQSFPLRVLNILAE